MDYSSVELHHTAEASSESPRLHKLLSAADIEEIRQTDFADGRQLETWELRAVLGRYGIEFTDGQFERLFLRVNTDRDNQCSWDEFVSHLLHGFRDDETYEHGKPLDLPIEEKPTFIRSQQRYAVTKVRFCPEILSDGTVDVATGNYITGSKDGTLVYWSQDFVYQFSVKSDNPNLVVNKTWITDFVPMPDVRIICTASIERDLRFYDTTAGNFHPRIIIARLPFEVTCMAYHFQADADSRIVCGDAGGNVLLFEFNPAGRGPFQVKTGSSFRQLNWPKMLASGVNGLRVRVFGAVHRDRVRHVEYSEALNAVFSAAECRSIGLDKRAAPGLVIVDVAGRKRNVTFRIPLGVTCFAFNGDAAPMIVTGGPDCTLRVWDHVTPDKAVAILTGHHDGITFLFLQDTCNRIYSIDQVRTIKVWDGVEYTLLQTYIAIKTALLTDHLPYTAVYNDNRRALVMAGAQIVRVHCRPLLRLDETDGYTHTRQVSVCMYNALFRSVITCGFDSMIIVWDALDGTRILVIRHAHTRTVHGEVLSVEITAGCFDTKQQLLLTGARDGTLKIWTVSAGVCQRNYAIEPMCEVTSVIWLLDRILAIGWNKHVTEFVDTEEDVFGVAGKEWDTLHSEDVSCMAKCEPFFMATGSYAAELVLWKLQTGQPYRRIDVDQPNKHKWLTWAGSKVTLAAGDKRRPSLTEMPSVYRHSQTVKAQTEDRQRRRSIVLLPKQAEHKHVTAVHAMLYLETRVMHAQRGTLMVALSTGYVQAYSHHPLAEKPYLDAFEAAHMAGDAVTAMATDAENRFLVTGTAFGYIKTWLVQNYCLPAAEHKHVNMPALRLQFPFLTNDRWLGRAKRSVRGVSNPLLVNSFKAHPLSVMNVQYMNEMQMLLSSSSDRSARMWTVGGRYIGTFGSPVEWPALIRDTPPAPDYRFRIPPDIRRVGSSTTLKVLQGGHIEDPIAAMASQQLARARELEVLCKPGEKMRLYGKPLAKPVLGNHVVIPKQEELRGNYDLGDLSHASVPIYHHLRYQGATIMKNPAEPVQLNHRRAQTWLERNRNKRDGASENGSEKCDGC